MEYKVSENHLSVFTGNFDNTLYEIYKVKETKIEFFGMNLFDLSSFDVIFKPEKETIYSATFLQELTSNAKQYC